MTTAFNKPLRAALAALLLGAALTTAGCEKSNGPMAPGDLSWIKVGMNLSQVEERIGMPLYINQGEFERAGRDQWVYKTGYLQIYRQVVRAVVPVDNPSQLPPHQRTRKLAASTAALDPFAKEDDGFYKEALGKTGRRVKSEDLDTPIYLPSN